MSTFPPRECGIATFTQDLLHSCQKFLGSTIECKVAALNLSSLDTYNYPPEVHWEIDQNDKKSHRKLAAEINNNMNISGVIVQHEYGIFGGEEGENILPFLSTCQKPVLVTLHTILPNPNKKMKEVTSKIIELATTVVVLTLTSQQLLEKIYPHSAGKTFVIPHGIHHIGFSLPHEFKKKLDLEKFTVLTTFGLLSRGKGIEYVIKALPKVIKKYPHILYLVLGETHPVVIRNEGEKYRNKLIKLITKLKLEKHVKFYDQYLDLPQLFEFLKATDIYISTSTDPNQAVSGTLSYALGTGRAVISTQFAQAKEIVNAKTGLLVPIKNSAAMSNALIRVLNNPNKLNKMHHAAYQATRPMLWNNVAKEYTSLLSRSIIPKLDLTHLHTMTDSFGLFQFAQLAIPNKDFGYTLDDNARALVTCSWLAKQEYTKELESLIITYLEFIKKCQLADGSFTNYLAYNSHLSTEQNGQEDIEDSQMRALWALSEVLSNQILPQTLQDSAKKMFLLKTKQFPTLHHLRAKAYAIQSFAVAQRYLPLEKPFLQKQIREYADSLQKAYKNNATDSWHWFEKHLAYNNGILSESLITAGTVLNEPRYIQTAVSSVDFLIKNTFIGQLYYPIGQSEWYKKDGKRSLYDQQPEDPASMISALNSVYQTTQKTEYKKLAQTCFDWFLGKNSLNIALYNSKNGGCFDGIHPDRLNLNQGAESLVSYLMSRIIIEQLN